MANCLILFTPRTGSSILADLLAFKYNAWNLDEILSHQIRPQVLNKLPPRVVTLLKQGNFNARVNLNGKGPDEFYYEMSKEVIRAFSFAADLAQYNDIVLKCYTYPAALPHKILQLAIQHNFEIYFLYRSNKTEQMLSLVTAMAKEKNNKQPWSGHIYTNKTKPSDSQPMMYDEKSMHNLCYQIGSSIHTWHYLHDNYKQYGVTMCYEDTIAKGDFTSASISKELFEQYLEQDEHLIPTRDKNLVTNWDKIKPIIENYLITNE